MHRDLPFGVDLSWYVSVMKVQELIHEQMLILTESHKIKEKNSFSIFTSLERTTLLLYQPTYFLTLIIPLASLWGPSSWSTTSLRLCAYFIEKDCYFCISLKLFPIFFCYNMKLVAHFQLFSLTSLVLNWNFSSQPFSCVSLIQLVCCCRPISRPSNLITNDWPKCFWGHD